MIRVGDRTRVACLGAGYFAQFHYDGWARLPEVELVGSCDIDLTKAATTGLPAYDKLGQMLSEADPDVLDVILPPNAQAASIEQAIAHGVKTIICQKPFCRALAEARHIAHLAEAAGVTLIIHENFRFQPWYRIIKTALDNGAIGQFHQATFRFRPGDGQGPRAYLDRQPYFQKMPRFLVHETAVHWIDTFRYLFGLPKSVYADLRRLNPVIEGEDAGYIIYQMPDGARALFDGNRHLDHASDNLRRTMGEALIEGSEGSLSLTGDGAVHLRPHGATQVETLLGPDGWDGFGGDCVFALQAHVVAGLRDGHALENLAQDYLKVLEIEEAVYASANLGHKIELGSE